MAVLATEKALTRFPSASKWSLGDRTQVKLDDALLQSESFAQQVKSNSHLNNAKVTVKRLLCICSDLITYTPFTLIQWQLLGCVHTTGESNSNQIPSQI